VLDELPSVPGYELGERIGRGGMGDVYRARDIELEREVAVKILQERYPLDSSAAIRFVSEAKITAQLQHPGIPAVYRVSKLVDGRPFLAMKLIKGQTLDELINSKAAFNHLALIESIAQALGYAHAHEIIHRDIKPANVMVGPFGDVQVMDWGLAKIVSRISPTNDSCASDNEVAIDPEVTTAGTYINSNLQGSSHTAHGSIVGTPAYMSPEQASGQGARVSFAADVFGLGALWCKLLTGEAPYTGEDIQSVYQRALKGKTDEAFSRLDRCGAEPEVVTLVKQCLALEPSQRPANANAVFKIVAALRVAAEERAKEAELSRARAEIEVVEQSKRRRVMQIAGGLIAAVLLIGLGISLWQMNIAQQERDAKGKALDAEITERLRAEQAERQANQERDAKELAFKAEQKARQQAFEALRSMTTDVVERKFAQGTTLTDEDKKFLRSVIAQYAAFATIQGDGADSRAIRAEGRARVGKMRHRLGELKEAQADYDVAVGVYKQLAADFPTHLEFHQDLAASHNNRGVLLLSMGKLKEAQADYKAALAIFKQLAADFPTRVEFRQELAKSHNNHGLLLRSAGRPNEAEREYDAALNIRKQLTKDFPTRVEFRQDLAKSHNNRSVLLLSTGRLAQAQADCEAALTLRKQLATDFPTRLEFRQELAGSYNNRGNLRRSAGRLVEALADFDTALAIFKQLAADFPTRPEFRQLLAKSHNNRAVLLRSTGSPNEADLEYEAALAIFKQLAADFPTRIEFRQDLAGSHNNRGNLLSAAGKVVEALADFEAAFAIYKRLAADFPTQPDLHTTVASTSLSLALLHQQQRDFIAAKQSLLDGRASHLAILKASPSDPIAGQFYRDHLSMLTKVHAVLIEKNNSIRTAEARRDLGWDPPSDAYDAAGFLSQCLPSVSKHTKLNDSQRQEAIVFYSNATLKMLREAIDKGFKDATKLKNDHTFAPLHKHPEFQKVLVDLQAKTK
jgi:tetratricopeptide (TPR) repeat protein